MLLFKLEGPEGALKLPAVLLSWCLFKRVIKNFSFGWEVACNFFFFFFLAFSMTWRIRTLQSLQFELNYPVKKPNPVLTLSIILSSSSISKDMRELQRFQLQNISQFPGPLMEFSHKPDVGRSDLASYICPKWMDHARMNHVPTPGVVGADPLRAARPWGVLV